MARARVSTVKHRTTPHHTVDVHLVGRSSAVRNALGQGTKMESISYPAIFRQGLTSCTSSEMSRIHQETIKSDFLSVYWNELDWTKIRSKSTKIYTNLHNFGLHNSASADSQNFKQNYKKTYDFATISVLRCNWSKDVQINRKLVDFYVTYYVT